MQVFRQQCAQRFSPRTGIVENLQGAWRRLKGAKDLALVHLLLVAMHLLHLVTSSNAIVMLETVL